MFSYKPYTTLLIGNPGVGKSTILNSILGRVVFKSGQSLGSGLTAVLQEAYDINGNRYIDTPGLSDVKKSERAAIEIEKALKKGGLFKIFFVITLESGRIRPDDINTIRLVLGAVSSINSCYSIIINKSQPEVLALLTEESVKANFFSKLFRDLPETRSVYFNAHEARIDAKKNAIMTLSESFLTFLKNAPRIKIGVEDVSKIPTSNYKKELKYLESKIDQVESENMFLKNQIAINLKMMDSMKTRIVGADEKQNSWNCWKAVVHDMSTEPSPGITLKKLAKHENVQSLSVTKTGLLINNMGCISVIEFGLFIHNKFGETFHLILIEVPSYGLVFHAFKLEESISFYFD